MKADVIYSNGMIRTMDPEKPEAESLAIADGRILHVGTKKECEELAGDHSERIDLNGKTLLPGFTDNHLHLLGYGISLIQVNLSGLTSIEQVVEKIRDRARDTKPGEWILGRGWDQNEYIEDRFFDRYDLDKAAQDHPVFVKRVCGHAAVANSKALEMVGVDKNTPNPGSGVIEKDPDTGEPNGILHEGAINLVYDQIPPYSFSDLKSALAKGMEKAFEAGITSVTTDDVLPAGGLEECIRLYKSLWEDGAPAVRAYLLVAGKFLEQALEQGYVTGWGDERVKIGPLKLFQDGSLGARTAALVEPYSDHPDTRGILIHPQKDLDAIIKKAHQGGMQIGVHAIGDAAILSTLESFALAQKESPRADSRHRIIHFEVVSPEILEKSKELEIIADIQPKFLTTDGAWLENRLGPERSTYACAWKTILDVGIPAVGGSDCPVEPLDPMLGIHAAVTRTVYSKPDESWHPQEKLTLEESVAMFTRDAGFGSFEEDCKGIIREGYLADFVVLESDPWDTAPERLNEIKVAMTVIDGKICYTKD